MLYRLCKVLYTLYSATSQRASDKNFAKIIAYTQANISSSFTSQQLLSLPRCPSQTRDQFAMSSKSQPLLSSTERFSIQSSEKSSLGSSDQQSGNSRTKSQSPETSPFAWLPPRYSILQGSDYFSGKSMPFQLILAFWFIICFLIAIWRIHTHFIV